jgi:hypothetical protein
VLEPWIDTRTVKSIIPTPGSLIDNLNNLSGIRLIAPGFPSKTGQGYRIPSGNQSTYPNQDTPLAEGLIAVIGVAVRELADHLKYQKRRA